MNLEKQDNRYDVGEEETNETDIVDDSFAISKGQVKYVLLNK